MGWNKWSITTYFYIELSTEYQIDSMAKTNAIFVRLTDEQREIVKKLVGVMGDNEAEVVRNIFLAWLSDKGIITEVIRKRWLERES